MGGRVVFRQLSCRRAPAVILLLVLVAGACGGDDSGEGDTDASSAGSAGTQATTQTQPASGGASIDDPNFNACGLLTVSEIQTGLGAAPAGPGEQKNVGVNRSCSWTLGESNLLVAQVLVYRDAKAADTGFQDIEKTFVPASSVTGVGERATFHTGAGSFGGNESDLTVLRGKATLSLHHSNRGTPASQAQLTDLAQKALARIKQ